jgi:hypothetical protein
MATKLFIIEEIFNREYNSANHSCVDCGELLSAYIEAELDGENAASLYPAVAEHLSTCEECSEEYADLKSILVAERDGTLVDPPTQPQFDLSFLRPVQPAPSLWQVFEIAGIEVRRLFTEIQIRVGRTTAAFGQLPSLLSPQLAPVAISRGVQEQPQAQILSLPASADDLSIGLGIGPVSQQEATIDVRTTQLSSGQPVPRARVAIRDAERRLLTIEHTNELGSALFDHLGSGQYLIEVRYQTRVFELPLTFTLEADPKP